MVLRYICTENQEHLFYNAGKRKALSIDKDFKIRVLESIDAELEMMFNSSKCTEISCIIGTIKLGVNDYIITGKHFVAGMILNVKICKLIFFNIIKVKNPQENNQTFEEVQYLKLLREHLMSNVFYFSEDNKYDLTKSLQRKFTNQETEYNEEFLWNHYLSEDLRKNKADEFVTNIINGYFRSYSFFFEQQKPLEFVLISRKSTKRSGTRYFRRGVDSEGEVANFYETEQLIFTKNNIAYSLLIIRGSIPIYWAEINNLRYTPNLLISSKSSINAMATHFRKLSKNYGTVYAVNLVNENNRERCVKKEFENVLENLPEDVKKDVRYIYFNFHEQCSSSRWNKIKILVENLIHLGYSNKVYFSVDLSTNKILSTQNMIIRTNCMDCLDRTNIVQSTISRWVLQSQLVNAGFLKTNNYTPWGVIDPNFNFNFQIFWSENGDSISYSYTGTKALMSDFTRTGLRTCVGIFNDFTSCLLRYFKNNFNDGQRQDGFDLFLGNFRPYKDSKVDIFKTKKNWLLTFIPFFLFSFSTLFFLLLFWRKKFHLTYKNFLFFLFFLLINIKFLEWIMKNCYYYIDWPKLVDLDFLVKKKIFDEKSNFVRIKYENLDFYKIKTKKLN